MRILIVEDDPYLRKTLKHTLESSGFVVDLAEDGIQGEFIGATEIYDLAILDLGLPGMEGLEVLKRWRSQNLDFPVIILTARDAWHERIDGFKAGADDYIGKPFHPEELLARISAVIKRSYGKAPKALSVGTLSLDEEQQTIRVGEQEPIRLTSTEYRILRYFLLNPGKLVSKTQLMEHLYGMDADPETNTLEVYINRLRKKIGDNRIQTRRGQGYLLAE